MSLSLWLLTKKGTSCKVAGQKGGVAHRTAKGDSTCRDYVALYFKVESVRDTSEWGVRSYGHTVTRGVDTIYKEKSQCFLNETLETPVPLKRAQTNQKDKRILSLKRSSVTR